MTLGFLITVKIYTGFSILLDTSELPVRASLETNGLSVLSQSTEKNPFIFMQHLQLAQSTISVGTISTRQYALRIYPVRWSLRGDIKTEKGFLEVSEFLQFPQLQIADIKLSLDKNVYVQTQLYPLSLFQTSEKAQSCSWSDIP